mgnify:CR=1 FL=1
MIDTVLLDLDDTILDFHKSEAFALKKNIGRARHKNRCHQLLKDIVNK